MAGNNDVLIASLKKKRRIAINNRRDLQKRKNKVEGVYGQSFGMDDYASSIDNKIQATQNHLSMGVLGIGEISTKIETTGSLKEKTFLSSQSNFSSAISHMSSEIRRLNDEINLYDVKIASYERQIRDEGGYIMPWD